jgi:eukaryotic-like serine/threonine-protein kinase
VQLEQSPYLNIVPESKIREALRLMGKPPDERLTNDVAREICQRQSIKAMLAGNIASLGDHYVITLAALSGATGDAVAREQVEVDRKEQVLKALDKAASNLRQKMGESLSSVQQFATPLEKATTPSLEALQAYTLGHDAHVAMRDQAAIPHLKKAIALDPNFAMAYATMGVAFSNSGRTSDAIAALKKAYELRDRASEREKLYIQAHYYEEVTLDEENALALYADWRQTYPRDTVPYDNAALASAALGQHEKALEFAGQAHRMDPQDLFAYDNLAGAYEALNRFDEAKSIAEEAKAKKLQVMAASFILTDLAYMRGDRAAYERELEAVKGTSTEQFLLFFNATWQSAIGKVKASRDFWQRARETASSSGAKEFAASILTLEAYDDALIGYQSDARQKASRALELSPDPDTRWGSTLALAAAGDVQRSATMVAGLQHDSPENRFIQAALAEARAIEQLQKDQLSQGIATLEPLRAYEFGVGQHSVGVTPVFLRGLLYLKMQDGAKAAAEFKRLLDHKGAASWSMEYPLARLNLARAYALQGDSAQSRTAYQDFFAAWKDADPDIPILKIAKAEYAKLN